MARVLVVDDDRTVGAAYAALLALAGHATETATDVDGALVLLDEGGVDVVLSDIVMPERTGIDLIRALRERGSRVPVVLYTGQAALETAGDAVRIRAFDYLPKPIPKETLLRAVADAAEAKARDDEYERLQEENRRQQQELARLVEERTRELRRSEDRFRTLAELAPVGVHLSDPEGRCVYANARWCEMAGLSLDQALGDGWLSCLHPDDRDMMAPRWQRMVQSEGRWGFEYRFRTAAGTTSWVYALAAPMRDASDRVFGYVGVTIDIAERKRAEEELRLSESRLIALAAELTRAEERERHHLAASLHDDIGQALALLRTRVGLLAEDIGEGKPVAAGIAGIQQGLDGAIESTNELTSDLSPPVLHQLGLGAAIEWAGEKTAREHGLEFVFDDDGGDRRLGEEAEAFVFRAARELMASAGKHAEATRLAATVECHSDEMRVTIEDDGGGDDGGSGGEYDSVSGGGGLSNVRQRLEVLGGRLDIGSTPGGGTRAVLAMPVEEGQQ